MPLHVLPRSAVASLSISGAQKGLPVAIDHASYQHLLQYRIPEVEHTLTTRDSVVLNNGRAEIA